MRNAAGRKRPKVGGQAEADDTAEEEEEPVPVKKESIIKQELRKAKAGQDAGTLNIAPRTADWDLKR